MLISQISLIELFFNFILNLNIQENVLLLLFHLFN
jgi:hypothetical protein